MLRFGLLTKCALGTESRPLLLTRGISRGGEAKRVRESWSFGFGTGVRVWVRVKVSRGYALR